MNQFEFDKIYEKQYSNTTVDISKKISRRIKNPRWYKKRIVKFFPIVDWLSKYNWKTDLVCDLIGGLTVGIMHVPQGMAYATLAGVEPIYGLYSSFFAATCYMFFGTSRHVSVGTFAVASMMVGAVRFKLIPEQVDMDPHEVPNLTAEPDLRDPLRHIDVMTLTSTLTFAVGLVQLMMGILRLSFLTTYVTDPLISGYTTGTAVHVFVAQINKVLGVKMPRYSGNGMLFFMIRDIIYSLNQLNWYTFGLSIFGLIFLYLGKEYINPVVKKRSPIPLPFELMLVIIGIIVSKQLDLKENHHVKIINHIPQGLPNPSSPRFDLIPELIFDAISIAIICYIFVVSLGKLFAKKHGYKIDPTQEFFALGYTQLICSLFPVYPTGCALSRSSVCEASGVKTQFYNVFSGILLLTVILWIGPVLEPLPMCILACIVMISLKSLFMQVNQLPKLWTISKYDFMIWIISFVATVLTTATFGLFISLGFVILTVPLRQQWPKFYICGTNETKTVLASRQIYQKLEQVSKNANVLKFESPLYFANITKFTDTLLPMLEGSIYDVDEECGVEMEEIKKQKSIILDCSAMTYIDSMGLEAIIQIYNLSKQKNIRLIFAGFLEDVINTLENTECFKIIDDNSVFPSVLEAIKYLDQNPIR